MFESADPDEIVRKYDGSANPIGKAYSIEEIQDMLSGLFTIERVDRWYLPWRWFRLRLPKGFKRWASERFGLMLHLQGTRLPG